MEKKRTLTLASDMNTRYRHWSNAMMNHLANSGYFEVKYEDFPPELLFDNRRAQFLAFFKVDDDLFGVDTWDSHYPTLKAQEAILASDFYSSTKMIFKTQRTNEDDKDGSWEKFENETGIKTSNWTMFPTEKFKLGSFSWLDNPYKKHYGIISGKRRPKWMGYYRNDPDFFVPPEIPESRSTVKVSSDRITFDGFLELLKNSLWGVSLHGKQIKGMDCKNRREVEYSSCGMPLVLNYKPEYQFPFNAGEHYYYVEKVEDLKNIKNVDPMPFHYKSLEAYEKWFSPQGSAKIFLDLVEKHLGK
jgi:hypothetical protein